MDHRYIVWRLPKEGFLRCEICGDAILSSAVIAASRKENGDVRALIEPTIQDHLRREHSSLLGKHPEVLVEPDHLHPDDIVFPDEMAPISAIERASPPRSPDEVEE